MRFWNIKDDKKQDMAVLHIDGDIVDDDDVWMYEWMDMPCASPNKLRAELEKRKGKDIQVWINSNGGSVFAAAGIYNALHEHSGRVTVIVDGMAASAASVIAMAGDPVLMSPVGMLMIHDPMSRVSGRADDFRAVADVLDKVKDTIINAYAVKTGLEREEIAQMMTDETYMTAGEAVRLGFADGLHGVDQEKAKVVNFRRGSVMGADDGCLRDALRRAVAKLDAEDAADVPEDGAAAEAAAETAVTDAADAAAETAVTDAADAADVPETGAGANAADALAAADAAKETDMELVNLRARFALRLQLTNIKN